MPAPRRWHEQDLILKDFSGGENQTDSEIALLPSELSDCLNVVGLKRGALQRRKGIAKFNATAAPVSGGGLLGIHKFYHAPSADMVVAVSSDKKVYSVPATGASTNLGLDHDAASLFTVTGASQQVSFAQYRNRLYGSAYPATDCNFVVATALGAGASVWKAGVQVPTKSGTLSETIGSGGLDEQTTYKYYISYFYGEDGAHGESNPGPEIELTLSAGGYDTITIVFFGAGANYQYADWDEAHDAGIDKVRIYRTEGDGSTFYYLTELTSGVGYEDEIADADLDDTTLPQSDNYPCPDKAQFLVVHQDRLIMGYVYDGTDYHRYRVQWSLAGYPDVFPTNNYADAPAEHGTVQGLAVLNGQLYVFYESAIARLTLFGGSDNSFEIVTSAAGLWAPFSLAVGEENGREVAFFMACDGRVYSFDGIGVRNISSDIEGRLDTIAPSYANVLNMVGGWDGRTYHLSYRASGYAYGFILRYDTLLRKQHPYLTYDTGTWWPQQLATALARRPAQMSRFDGGTDEGALYFCTDQAGFIYELDSGNDDDGKDIGYYAYTAYLDAGDGGMEKYLESIMVDSESDTAIGITWDTDWDTATNTFDTTTGSSPVRTYHDPAGRVCFRYIRLYMKGSDGDAPSTIYALIIRLGGARPARKT